MVGGRLARAGGGNKVAIVTGQHKASILSPRPILVRKRLRTCTDRSKMTCNRTWRFH